MEKNILQIKNLTKIYKKNNKGIKNINLNFQSGKIYGLIGPNGAGKTTLIKVIVGAYSKSGYTGEIFLFDKNIKLYSSSESRQIAYIPEKTVFPNSLKVKDYLRFILDFDFINYLEVEHSINNICQKLNWIYLLNCNFKELSSGERKKVLLLQAFASSAKIIIMDEPTTNLDPQTREDVLSFCRAMTQTGVTIIVSTHILSEIENFIDETIFIFDGEIKKLANQENKRKLLFKVDKIKFLIEFLEQKNFQFKIENQNLIIENLHLSSKNQIINFCLTNDIEIFQLNDYTSSLISKYRQLVNQKAKTVKK